MMLNAGAGRCRADAQVSIRAATPVIELGAVADVLHAALNAAHHANRHADADDMLAVALPGLHMRRGQARPGHEVVLFGSERRLEAYLDLEGVATLRRRGMLVRPEIREAWMDEGETGTAYLRDRSVARRSPGTLRRAKARAERRGATFRKDAKAHVARRTGWDPRDDQDGTGASRRERS